MASLKFVVLFVGIGIISFCETASGAAAPSQMLMLNPYVVKVSYSPIKAGEEPIRCTGAIYNTNWIITSARCAKPTVSMMNNDPTHDYGDINMGDDEPLGQCKPEEFGRVRYVAEAQFPPGALEAIKDNKPLDEFDIAMIKVNKPIIYSKVMKAIRVPTEPKHCADDSTVSFLMGFGKGGEKDPMWERKLRKFKLKFATEDESKAGDSTHNADTRLVAKAVDKESTCGVDLGAPLVNYVKVSLPQAPVDIYKNYLCGVLRRTFCEDDGRAEGIELFAKVTKWTDWIAKTGGPQDKFEDD